MEAAVLTKPGEAAHSCAECSPPHLALAEYVPAARLQIRPGETRVVSVLVWASDEPFGPADSRATRRPRA